MISFETGSAPPPNVRTTSPASAAPPSDGPAFADLLRTFAARIDGGEALMHRASAGSYAEMDAGRLIALQAGIYRYSEAVELGAKLVDRAASSVRAVLQAGH